MVFKFHNGVFFLVRGEVYVVQECKKPVSLYAEQRGLKMVQVGLNWFLNQKGAASTTHLE